MPYRQSGKRTAEAIGDRAVTSGGVDPINGFNNKFVLDYILAQVGEGECPYVKVEILGLPFYGLLDSGANKVFINLDGWNLLKSIGVKLTQPSNVTCRVADDSEYPCIGTVSVPIRLRGVVKVFDIYIFPKLRHKLVLGMDFWIRMGVVPDVRKGEWYFSSTALDEPVSSSILAETDLEPSDLDRLNKIVNNYFSRINNNKLGCTTAVQHKIRVQQTEPIKQRYYPVSPGKQAIIDKELDKMLQLGVVEKSNSAWSSPVLLVPKPDNSWRFCVDFRKLNKVTERDAYPLPYISDILRKLGGAKYLSSLDIQSAYWQVELEPASKQYTAFTVPSRGLFQFTRMPFGLHNAPATFQRLVDTLFGPELDPYLLKYLDDLIIVAPTLEKHLEVLELVLKRLEEANLSLNRDKCHFCRPELKFLGYVVNRSGIAVDPGKVEAITNLSPPKTVREVRRIIGMITWYRRFVEGFSDIISPLTKLLRKGKKFDWDESCEQSFQKIKDALVSAPILACPNFNYPFYIQTDASAYGLGAVLTQRYNDREYVICYLSCSLTRAQQNYSSVERECLGVLWAVEKLRCYVELSKFYIITDCHSLQWLENLKDPQGRLGRWALRLQQFDYEVIHRRGKDHIVPDALSRAVPTNDRDEDVIEVNCIEVSKVTDPWYIRMRVQIEQFPLKYPRWRVDSGKIYKYVEPDFPELRQPSDFWKLVIPKESRRDLIKRYHDDITAGHLGVYKTFHRLARLFYWKGMRNDVSRYVQRCQICLKVKPEQKRPAGFMGKPLEITKCWQVISTDLCGPLPRSSHGNQYILVVTDNFSKFSLFFPLRRATALAVTKLMKEQIFMVFGVPQHIKCDNGVQFRSREFSQLCQKFGVRTIFNPNYSPHCNPTERVNRVLKSMLSAYVGENQRKWDDCLAELGCAYRSARHEVTQNSPYFVNFGQEMVIHGDEYKIQRNDASENRLPPDKVENLKKLRDLVKKCLTKASDRTREQYNLRRRPVDYAVGDWVWKRQYVLSDAAQYFTSKLAGKYSGPFRVKKKVGYCAYELEDEAGKSLGTWHVKDLKPNPDP